MPTNIYVNGTSLEDACDWHTESQGTAQMYILPDAELGLNTGSENRFFPAFNDPDDIYLQGDKQLQLVNIWGYSSINTGICIPDILGGTKRLQFCKKGTAPIPYRKQSCFYQSYSNNPLSNLTRAKGKILQAGDSADKIYYLRYNSSNSQLQISENESFSNPENLGDNSVIVVDLIGGGGAGRNGHADGLSRRGGGGGGSGGCQSIIINLSMMMNTKLKITVGKGGASNGANGNPTKIETLTRPNTGDFNYTAGGGGGGSGRSGGTAGLNSSYRENQFVFDCEGISGKDGGNGESESASSSFGGSYTTLDIAIKGIIAADLKGADTDDSHQNHAARGWGSPQGDLYARNGGGGGGSVAGSVYVYDSSSISYWGYGYGGYGGSAQSAWGGSNQPGLHGGDGVAVIYYSINS